MLLSFIERKKGGVPMLKAYIATTKWSDRYMPSGTKIILADSREEAEQILQGWTNSYLEEERQRDADRKARIEKDLQEETDKERQERLRKTLLNLQEDPNLVLDWDLEERPLVEKGIFWDTGITWLSETP